MKWRILMSVVAMATPIQVAGAQDYPGHEDICVGGIVSKHKLAKAFLKQHDDWQKLYIDADEPATTPQHRPQWRRIFTDPNFCDNNPGCISLNPETKVRDTSVALKTLEFLRFSFANSLITQTRAGGPYTTANPNIGAAYFLGPDSQNAITCVRGRDVPVAVKPPPGIKLPIRLRGNSDDLNINAATQKDAFKGVKPAIASFTREGVDQKTNTLRVQAAIGYPIAIDIAPPAAVSYFNAEVVPYFSANQTVTKVDGKARTFNAANHVAVGTLVNAQMMFYEMAGVNHVFLAKPQYLWNTKDHSEIASLKFIYQPWTAGAAPTVNTPFPIRTGVADTWVQLLFDLRYLSGTYADRGNDPATAAKHNSFARGGTRLGIAITTPAFGPHVTLSVTETLLYGFSGEVRYLSLFESALSFYFDSTNNLAFTILYKAGRDEYTVERARSLTAGFSAKF